MHTSPELYAKYRSITRFQPGDLLAEIWFNAGVQPLYKEAANALLPYAGAQAAIADDFYAVGPCGCFAGIGTLVSKHIH